MNEEMLLDAIGELPDELLEPVAAVRRRKLPVSWLCAAASLVLAVGLSLFSLPMFRAESKNAAQINKTDGFFSGWDSNLFAEAPEMGPAESGTPGTENDWCYNSAEVRHFTATVLEAHGDYLIVTPLEGESERLSSEQFFIGIPEDCTLEFHVGDTVDIFYSGLIAEVSPAIPQRIVAVVIHES